MNLQDFQLPGDGDCAFVPLDAPHHAQRDALLATQTMQGVGYHHWHGEYQHRYFSTAFPCYRRLDALLTLRGEVVGLWPLAVFGQPDALVVSSHVNGARGIVPPVLRPDLSEKQEKAVARAWIKALGALAACLGDTAESRWRIVSPAPWTDAPLWYAQLQLQGGTLVGKHRIVHDLRLPEAEAHRHWRKSYKALVNQAAKLWTPLLDTRGDAALFADFQALHVQVAGRQTRPDSTWAAQFDAIAAGAAYAVYLHDADQRLIGASLYNCSRDEVYYAVGAYDRALFDQPVAHLSIATAIAHARASGRQRFILGDRPFPGDTPPPNDKEAKIAFFKEGFASSLQLLPGLEIDAASLASLAKFADGEPA